MDINNIKNSIRNIPNFPKPGIQYKDITTLLLDHEAFKETIKLFSNAFKNKEIDVIVGIESRGFIFAAPLAIELGCRLALARKPDRLPYKKVSQNYKLEYGSDKLEMHVDAINKKDKVLIIDDLLATGGTANAVGKLVSKLEGQIISFAFLIQLNNLKGIKALYPHQVFTIVDF